MLALLATLVVAQTADPALRIGVSVEALEGSAGSQAERIAALTSDVLAQEGFQAVRVDSRCHKDVACLRKLGADNKLDAVLHGVTTPRPGVTHVELETVSVRSGAVLSQQSFDAAPSSDAADVRKAMSAFELAVRTSVGTERSLEADALKPPEPAKLTSIRPDEALRPDAELSTKQFLSLGAAGLSAASFITSGVLLAVAGSLTKAIQNLPLYEQGLPYAEVQRRVDGANGTYTASLVTALTGVAFAVGSALLWFVGNPDLRPPPAADSTK